MAGGQGLVPRNLYCEIFVDADVDRNGLALLIAQLTGAALEGTHSLTHSVCEMDVMRNATFDPDHMEEPGDFVNYPLLVEVEPARGISDDAYIAFIGRLLENFWSKGYRAVAAASFEELLPRHGGYYAGDPHVMPQDGSQL